MTLHSDILKLAGVSSRQVHNQRDYSDYQENQFPNKIFIPSQKRRLPSLPEKLWRTEETKVSRQISRERFTLALLSGGRGLANPIEAPRPLLPGDEKARGFQRLGFEGLGKLHAGERRPSC